MVENENLTREENQQETEVKENSVNENPVVEEQQSSKDTVSDFENQVMILKDQLARALADHDNYKRRTQKEYSQIVQNANEKLMTEILPVLDDMERAMKAVKDLQTEDTKIQQFIQGFGFIHQKFTKILQERGLKPMESVGKTFDPELHDALMQLEKPDMEPNTIVDEHEKGYYLYDKVIRHAKVIVSKSS